MGRVKVWVLMVIRGLVQLMREEDVLARRVVPVIGWNGGTVPCGGCVVGDGSGDCAHLI